MWRHRNKAWWVMVVTKHCPGVLVCRWSWDYVHKAFNGTHHNCIILKRTCAHTVPGQPPPPDSNLPLHVLCSGLAHVRLGSGPPVSQIWRTPERGTPRISRFNLSQQIPLFFSSLASHGRQPSNQKKSFHVVYMGNPPTPHAGSSTKMWTEHLGLLLSATRERA